jgi:EpsI family protein
METAKKNLLSMLLPAALALVVAGLYWSTMSTLWQRWLEFDESYGHGLLLLAVIIWWFYDQRALLYSLPTSSFWPALLPLSGVCAIWWVAAATDILVVQQLLLPWIWWSAVALLGGRLLAKHTFFAALLFCFAVPIWDHLNDYLIEMTVVVVTNLLTITAMPVLIQGNEIHIPSGIITVADGCSGLRYLIIGTAFCLLSGQLFFRQWSWRLSLLVLGIVLGLLTNWLRVYSLVVIGYLSDMRSGLIADHELYGFVLFGVIFSSIYLLIRWRGDNRAPTALSTSFAAKPFSLAMFAVCTVLLLAAPVSLALILKAPPAAKFIAPPSIQGYATFSEPPASMQPAFFRPIARAEQVEQWLNIDGQAVLLARFFYRQQEEKQDFMPYRWLFARNHWLTLREDHRWLTDGTEVLIQEMASRISERRLWLVAYWMQVADRAVINPYLAKLAELPALSNGRHDAALITVQLPCDIDCTAAQRTLANFLIDHGDELQQQTVGRWQALSVQAD